MIEASMGAGLPESLVEPADLVVVHVVEEARIRVHRLRDGGVPEQGLYDLWALALIEELRGEGVSSVAKVCRRLWKVKPSSPRPALCSRDLYSR